MGIARNGAGGVGLASGCNDHHDLLAEAGDWISKFAGQRAPSRIQSRNMPISFAVRDGPSFGIWARLPTVAGVRTSIRRLWSGLPGATRSCSTRLVPFVSESSPLDFPSEWQRRQCCCRMGATCVRKSIRSVACACQPQDSGLTSNERTSKIKQRYHMPSLVVGCRCLAGVCQTTIVEQTLV